MKPDNTYSILRYFLIFASFFLVFTPAHGNISGYIVAPSDDMLNSVGAELQLPENEIKRISPNGIPLSYAGFSDFTGDTHNNTHTNDGFFSFPRMHKSEKLTVIVTEKLSLNKVEGHTISDTKLKATQKKSKTKQLDPNQEAAFYLYEKKKDDENAHFWHVTKLNSLPGNKVRSYNLVIYAQPRTIHIATGDFPATDTSQMILPKNITVVGNTAGDASKALDQQQYFESIKIKHEAKDVVQKQLTN